MGDRRVKVAAVQASPILPMNKEATTEKACRLIEEAGREGARLVVFPEGFIPMFPNWSIDMQNPTEWSRNLTSLTKESVVVPGKETEALGEAARKAGAYVMMGLNERHALYEGTIYNSLILIGPGGRVLGRHRKFTPSHRERVFHARGDGSDLRFVVETEIGRIGGLICYEHLQPLFRYALMAQGEQIHCACWPGGWPHFEPPGRSNKGVMQQASRQYAAESQTFVVLSSTYIPPEMAEAAELGNAHWGFHGGSAIIAPTGEYVVEPLWDEEGILYAEIDLDDILARKCYIDPVGRDARWDVVRLSINDRPYSPFAGEPALDLPQSFSPAGGKENDRLDRLVSRLDRLAGRLEQLLDKNNEAG